MENHKERLPFVRSEHFQLALRADDRQSVSYYLSNCSRTADLAGFHRARVIGRLSAATNLVASSEQASMNRCFITFWVSLYSPERANKKGETILRLLSPVDIDEVP